MIELLQNNSEWKKWMGKTTGRKGMGMELALLVLFVVFACTVLLVSSALIGKSNMNDQKDELQEKLLIDELAEGFLSGDLTAEKIADSEHLDELQKKFADYAVFSREEGAANWRQLWPGAEGATVSPVTAEADERLDGLDYTVAVLITDLAGNPLLTTADLVDGGKNGHVLLWHYH